MDKHFDRKYWYPIIMTGFSSILSIAGNTGDTGKMLLWLGVSFALGVALWWLLRLFDWLVKRHNELEAVRRAELIKAIEELIDDKTEPLFSKVNALEKELKAQREVITSISDVMGRLVSFLERS